MMRRILLLASLAIGLLAGPARAEPLPGQQEAMQLLQRVAAAAGKLSYSGTFVYRNGTQSETSRIRHAARDGNRWEKLEVLDGSPREVIRHNDEVRCYLPELRLVIVEQQGARRTFPALLPTSLAGLGEHYSVRKLGTARIAGFDSQIVRLEPRDKWRYGHQFWVDPRSGLLLKADLFDAQGESLESVVFTELRIGEPAGPQAFEPGYSGLGDAGEGAWQVRQARLREIRDDARWQFRAELPGFRRQAAMLRSISRGTGVEVQEVLHWVYSDGLAALSVFISPIPAQGEAPGDADVRTMGAMSVVKRVIDGHQVVVMGDVPPAAASHFAAGVGVKDR